MNFDACSLEPLILDHKTTNKLFIAQDNNKQYLIKTYSGDNKELRKQAESKRITIWEKHGLPVPRVYDANINFKPNTPYLVIEFINGKTLKELLKDPCYSIEKKLSILSLIFKANAHRHRVATQHCDSRLIHHDLNSGNLIVNANKFTFIDFEGSFSKTNSINDIQDKVAIEVAKLIRWAAMDMGKRNLKKILEAMIIAYKDTNTPEIIINRIHNRPFQFIHRWKDKQKKSKHPHEVTKYDIADTLKTTINSQT